MAALAARRQSCPLLQVTTVAYDGNCNAEGLYDGKGSCTFVSGNRYTGSFQLGLMHGRGRYEWPHGLVYEGQFDCNRATGTGVSIMPL